MFVFGIFLVIITGFIFYLLKQSKLNRYKNKCINNNLIATITHDLKTPAIAQIRALDLLLNGNFGEVNDSQKLFIKDIMNSCGNMLDMLVNLLWLYKFDNNKIAVNKTNFCINDLIREIFNENKLLFNSYNREFVFQNNTAKIYISADRTHIKRVIFNLLVNAINHSGENSAINIITTITNNKFILIIKSTGKYIPDDMLECIKSRAVVFNQKSNVLSTGLGLYLSNSLLKLNNGKFICHSSKDGTNSFGFVLDLTKSSSRILKNISKQLIKK